ncbi:sensor histidine kinase [Pseudonocardia phyllosphaerae]|uniref:sensor histidine kinase n=1 Tax=Pseudonocardia phyllosphaerae TaxID=3390502 RepID=UPI00397A5F32
MAGGFSGVLGRHRRWRFVAGHLADVLVVVALCVLVVAFTRPAYVADRGIDLGQAVSILTLAAAGVGSAAAIVALVTGRLTEDPRPSWFGAALLLYGVVIMPISALVVRNGGGVARLAVLVMLLVVYCMLLAALRPPARLGAWGGWVLLVLALLLGGIVAAQEETPLVAALTYGPLVSIVAQTGWTVVAVLFLFDGYRRQSRVRSRLGLGMVVVAVSQLYRSVVPAEPIDGLTYPALRLAGMAVVLSALLTLALRTVSRFQDDYSRSQEMTGDAARRLERATELAAERDHELKNGLAGLAGAAHLLSHDAQDPETARMREAVLSELVRLRHMLENPLLAHAPGVATAPVADPEPVYVPAEGDAELLDFGPLPTADTQAWVPPEPAAAGNGRANGAVPAQAPVHHVEPVLEQLVRLRAQAGVTLEVEPGLPPVAAPEKVSRQVVTNLLENCRRHAPGAPVRVRACSSGEGVVRIEVRDSGPGLPPGQEEIVLRRGVHDESAGGSGLGLHISAQLAYEHQGDLVLRSADSPRGCLAVLTLPVAT